jgi:pyrroline-5-carboxylate reductase
VSLVETLADIDRIHDAEPERAAAALRSLDAAALDDAGRRRYALLVNHVLGEKLGAWREACERLAPLAGDDASLPVLRQHAVAAKLSGDAAVADAALARLAARSGAAPASARLAVEVAAFGFTALSAPHATTLAALAARAAPLPSGPMDAALAAGFNNATTALYYATRADHISPALSEGLQRGADAALVFWLRAGGWQEQERAHYLCAKMALRTGATVAAVAHAERGLALVAANGDDAIEKAFLLALLAAAAERGGAVARAAALRVEAEALVADADADTRALLVADMAEFPPLAAPPRVAFIGGGNLAAALIGGLQRAGALAALHVVEVDAARRAHLERTFGASTAAAADGTLAAFDVIVLAVKPQQMREACSALRPHTGAGVLLSVAAGVRADAIARWCGSERVVRAMPNTPALIGAGISGAAARAAVTPAQRSLAERVLSSVGPVLWFEDEAQLDAVTAISGSGPAYVFRFIEALQHAAEALGLPPDAARELALHTVAGAGRLALESGEDAATLRERVTSKGGTTAAALAELARREWPAAVEAAARAAAARAAEMGREFDERG